ncbi:hypothetical protein [Paenibacillus sp. GbtcB18]|uniref:hypothetical protein n=1 Tax=Paenibacillus sp. GbtcB18 TaxID=2824763 RepID=UPI001C30CFBC|nr:hypothetical protein [Paenibacillus sp. GbtcB18]
MENTQFKHKALEVVYLIENGINSLNLFSHETKKIINAFAELELSSELGELRRYILSVYTRYQGKVDFRNKENPKNQEIKQKFLEQLADIKSKLREI